MRSPRLALSVVGWVVATTAARIIAVWCAVAAFGVGRPLLAALLVVPAVELASLIPLIPGNLGVTSALVTLALRDRHVTLLHAISVGVALHAVELCVGVCFGLGGVLVLGRPRLARRMLPVLIAIVPAGLLGLWVTGTYLSALPLPGRHALASAVGAAALVWLGPPGTDLAAHLYQRSFFILHGFSGWNNYWYAGRYSFVTYSLLYYPLAAVVGIKLLAVASIAASAGAFALLVEREWRGAGPWPARAFSAVCGASVLTGAMPYALGFTFATLSLLVLKERRHWLFFALVLLTFASSPLAFVLLSVVLLGVALAGPARAAVLPGVAVAITGGFGLLLWRVFPDQSLYPFSTAELAAAVGFSVVGAALTWRVERARTLRNVFIAYGIVCVAAFAMPSELGENVIRLRYIAAPIAVLALSLRGWRPLLPAVLAVTLAIAWNVTPLAFSFVHSASDPSSNAAYWRPTLQYLHRHLSRSYRVEVVDTIGHWEAAYLPEADVPIARGWFRQDDFPLNQIFYGATLTRGAYLRWLHAMGVEYVVLTDAPTDYSARAEAALLRSGNSGLRRVFIGPHTRIFAVPSPSRLVTGPGNPRVVALTSSSVTLAIPRPGEYRLAIRYSPYWVSTTACVTARADGMSEIEAKHAGAVALHFSIGWSSALATLTGGSTGCR